MCNFKTGGLHVISSANLIELFDIVNSTHSDPHHILGMHEVYSGERLSLAVRAFLPQAKKIEVVGCDGDAFCAEMEKLHEDGFFELMIKRRRKRFKYKLRITWYDGSEWTTADPYSFLPVISELDRHLFGEGTHYNIFDKLGSHMITHDGVLGVGFAVWAPNAARVSVIGDFNDWDGRRHQMRMLGASGIWEIFVPGLGVYDKYKYEIKSRDGSLTQKIDPYGNWFEMRPSTSTVIFDINRYVWRDGEWMANRVNPSKLPVNIYEAHLGSWKRGEENRFLSYRELADQMVPYVKEMNYNYIELLPVEEHPFDGSWGYQVTGYFAPTSRYGTPDEFMYFVDACHQNGIGVILDWVPAHFPKDAHGLRRFDGTALYEHDDPRRGEHPDWGTCIFNYGRKEVKNFLIANAIFWLKKYHIDGLRVDAVASMLYLDYGANYREWLPNEYGGRENLHAIEFMKHMNSVILGHSPDVMMIAEESTSWAGVSRPPEQGGLGFNFKWNMGWMNDFLAYIKKEPVHRKFHHTYLTFAMMYAYNENFVLVLSHDEVVHLKNSLIGKIPGDIWQKCATLKASYGFMYGFPGKKLLFMGQEYGQFSEWTESRPLDWFMLGYDHHRLIHEFVRDLNRLYLEERSLWAEDYEPSGFEWVSCDDADRSLLSFIRMAGGLEDFLVFAINFTPQPYFEHRVGVPAPGVYREILNSDDYRYGGSGVVNTEDIAAEQFLADGREYSVKLKLPPLAVIVLRRVSL